VGWEAGEEEWGDGEEDEVFAPALGVVVAPRHDPVVKAVIESLFFSEEALGGLEEATSSLAVAARVRALRRESKVRRRMKKEKNKERDAWVLEALGREMEKERRRKKGEEEMQ
jgi:hypothetical protein